MSNQYDVSVVIPVFNHLDLTQQIIKNIEDTQKNISYELIIINDGSSDRTQEWLEKNKKPNWTIVHQRNKGTNAARNIGVEKATAPKIAIFNNDIIIPEGCLQQMVNGFTDPDIWMVQTRSTTSNPIHYGDKVFFLPNHIHGRCYMINQEAKDFLFPIDSRLRVFGGDNRLFFKMIYAGYKLKILKDVVIHHLESQTVRTVKNVDRPIFFQIAKEQGWYVQPLQVNRHEPTTDILFGF